MLTKWYGIKTFDSFYIIRHFVSENSIHTHLNDHLTQETSPCVCFLVAQQVIPVGPCLISSQLSPLHTWTKDNILSFAVRLATYLLDLQSLGKYFACANKLILVVLSSFCDIVWCRVHALQSKLSNLGGESFMNTINMHGPLALPNDYVSVHMRFLPFNCYVLKMKIIHDRTNSSQFDIDCRCAQKAESDNNITIGANL